MSEALYCTVCKTVPLYNPQLLGCHHTFCHICVHKFPQQKCPTCRAPFLMHEVKVNFAVAEIVNQMFPNIQLISAEEQAYESGSLHRYFHFFTEKCKWSVFLRPRMNHLHWQLLHAIFPLLVNQKESIKIKDVEQHVRPLMLESMRKKPLRITLLHKSKDQEITCERSEYKDDLNLEISILTPRVCMLIEAPLCYFPQEPSSPFYSPTSPAYSPDSPMVLDDIDPFELAPAQRSNAATSHRRDASPPRQRGVSNRDRSPRRFSRRS